MKEAWGLVLGLRNHTPLLQQHRVGGLGVQYRILDAQIVQGDAERLLAGISDWVQFPSTFLPVPRCVYSISFCE